MVQTRPFREPHHSASMAALVGGGQKARPGEISLAHFGVLFLDELAEFSRPVLDALRQPLETAEIVVARANHHISYPARFQLIAAMNPCRCGYLGDPTRACSRAPACGRTYSARVSGPMMDRFDLIIEVPEVPGSLLLVDQKSEASAVIALRVQRARDFAQTRPGQRDGQVNARLSADQIDDLAGLNSDGEELLKSALEKQKLSARGFHKVLRVARTIADIDQSAEIARHHLAEALAYRSMPLLA